MCLVARNQILWPHIRSMFCWAYGTSTNVSVDQSALGGAIVSIMPATFTFKTFYLVPILGWVKLEAKVKTKNFQFRPAVY